MAADRREGVLDRWDFPKLPAALSKQGFAIVGPTVRDGAIVYDEIASDSDLPAGWTEEQDGGTYRLIKRGDAALFGYVIGPDSWKKFLFPPVLRLWKANRRGGGIKFLPDPPEARRRAFLGVRACEIAAIAVQDKILLRDDPHYRRRREATFIAAFNCGRAAKTCFCVSMKTGPHAESGFDLVLTEIIEGGRHEFVVGAGSDRGEELLRALPCRGVRPSDLEAVRRSRERAVGQMGRTLETADIKDLLYRNMEHPRWDDVAARCLTCGNCTMVCPTCFCTSIEDAADLSITRAERWRRWDSCFTLALSYLHGGSVRISTKSRYRQWMTHKLAGWIDQFGTSGCVGCGRCITWCPVGIDLTEEAKAIRGAEAPVR